MAYGYGDSAGERFDAPRRPAWEEDAGTSTQDGAGTSADAAVTDSGFLEDAAAADARALVDGAQEDAAIVDAAADADVDAAADGSLDARVDGGDEPVACAPSCGEGKVCEEGQCTSVSCDDGFAECDGDGTLVCEVDLTSDPAHCGTCNTACTNAHGDISCEDSTCEPSCDADWDDCDMSPDNGCETALTSIEHCGACGRTCPSDEGTPVCVDGECDARCDLSGTFALKISAPVSWPRSGELGSGSGVFEFWLGLHATHAGDEVSVQIRECGEAVPPLYAWRARESSLLAYPNSLYEAAGLPSTSATLELGDASPDAALTLPAVALQLGIDLPNPLSDPWPATAGGVPESQRVDMDGDGNPGVTATYSNAGDYVYPRTSDNLVFLSRADRAYMARRLIFSLDGALTSCTTSGGEASISRLDSRVYACRISSGSNCTDSQADHLDDNAPAYQFGSDGTYVLKKVDDDAGCATIRAALP